MISQVLILPTDVQPITVSDLFLLVIMCAIIAFGISILIHGFWFIEGEPLKISDGVFSGSPMMAYKYFRNGITHDEQIHIPHEEPFEDDGAHCEDDKEDFILPTEEIKLPEEFKQSLKKPTQ